MIVQALVVASLLIPAGGDLLPGRAERAFVKVEGIQSPFYLAPRTLRHYSLKPGQTISPELARKIMRQHGVDYPPEIERRLNEMERAE